MPHFTCQNRRLHYRQLGEGPLLLILPGNTASSALHEGELAFFAGLGYHAVSPDFAGTGLSERLPRPWPLDWFQQNAADCAALLDTLSAAGCVVVGTSGGAITALWMAILYPGQVSAVIADSEAEFFTPGSLTRAVQGRLERSEGQVGFWSTAHGADWEAVVDADSELLESIDRAHAPAGGWLAHKGRLGEIRCPALFTCALTDSLVENPGAEMLAMSAQVPGSLCFAVNGGDHPLMWSRPAEFRAAAGQFLRSLPRECAPGRP